MKYSNLTVLALFAALSGNLVNAAESKAKANDHNIY